MLSTQLAELRRFGGARLTEGLSDALLNRFAESDPRLAQAISEALAAQAVIAAEFPDLMDLDEAEQLSRVQSSFVNFYPDDGVNPYVAIAGRGPWVVTLKGAVVHDSGGYGMLGFGHAPDFVIEAMAQPQVMANVMTANVSQLRLAEALKRE
nr:lysine 6-aminotransferase [Xanthomonadales bacterium]